MNNYDKLNELHELFSKGVISQVEFEQFKQKLLNESSEEKKPSNNLNTRNPKLLKRLIFLTLTIVFFSIGSYKEYDKENTTDNLERTITFGVVVGLSAAALASIAMAFVSGYGPVVMLVGALVGSVFGGMAGSALGEEIGDAIWGDENRTAASAGEGKNKAIDFKSVGMQ